MTRKEWGAQEWWFKPFWKLKNPAKSRLLFWCILRNKVPTWDNL